MKDRVDVEAAYRRHGHSVLRRAREILRSEADAQEVLQEVFLRLWRTPEEFDGRSRLSTWLYAVTTHACWNRLRDEKNRARLLGEHAGALLGDGPPSGPEARITLQQLLARLPLAEAQAAVHHHVDGLTHEEIAEVMGCSRRHVGNLLERALATIRKREITNGTHGATLEA